MLDVAEQQAPPKEWRHIDVLAEAEGYYQKARDSFWCYRRLIDPNLIYGWWHEHVSHRLQLFYDDIKAGKRPKLVLSAPPQHGKSRVVTDFMSWLLGRDPSLGIVYSSYSDELRAIANLRFQRVMDQEQHRRAFPETRLALPSENFQRNTTICELVGADPSTGAAWRQRRPSYADLPRRQDRQCRSLFASWADKTDRHL